MKKSGYLSAGEAAEALGISLPTLYSYVSRGLLRSEEANAGKRTRRYRQEDVEKLQRRKAQRRNPDKVMEDALHWGAPLLESAITLIENDRFYYRGRDAVELAVNHTVEEVASLIWNGNLTASLPELSTVTPPSGQVRAIWRQLGGQSHMEQFQSLLPVAAIDDLAAYDLQPDAVIRTGGRILQLMATVAAGDAALEGTIAQRLQKGWVPHDEDAAKIINMALILCADHELNVSSFTARCVASAGATPYQAVIAGLAALQGVKHGRLTERVEAFMREIDSPAGIRGVMAGRLKRGETVPGFGHPLYPGGDPRARVLLEQLAAVYPESSGLALANEIVDEAAALLGKQPTVDFGLVVTAQMLKLPPDAPVTLFALGRTIGWIGHALEAYRADRIIRPRARYVGDLPLLD